MTQKINNFAKVCALVPIGTKLWRLLFEGVPCNGESEYFSEASAFYEPPHRFRLRRYGRRIFRPKNFSTEKFWADFFSVEKFRPKIFFGRIFFGRKIFARFFSWGGLGGRSRSNHFKKFAKANFLKWCRGGLPPQESPLPVPCPPGGVWGASPPRNLR